MVKSAQAREREMKLAADLDFELPDLRRVVGGTERIPELNLRTVYLDTDDLRLWAEGLTLRHRTGEGLGADGIWTLKIPAGGPGAFLDRQEITWPGSGEVVPEEVKSVLRGIIRHRELTVVVELRALRRRLVLRDRSGEAWGEVDDDTVTVVGGPRDGERFRQLELELRDEYAAGTGGHAAKRSHRRRGRTPKVEVVVERLQAAGATLGDGQKLAKALGLEEKAPPPALGPSPVLGRHSSVGDVVRASLIDACRRLSAADLPLRSDLQDPPAEAVHQARVATRRLRSDLKALASALDPLWVGHTRDELKWLGEKLGRVRDIDVLDRRLTPDPQTPAVELAGLADLRRRSANQRLVAINDLADALSSDRYLILLDRLHAAALRPPYEDHGTTATAMARRVLPGVLRRRRKALVRKVAQGGGKHRPDLDDGELHQIRIRAKQVRYVAETAGPVLGKSAARTAAAAEELQSVLGHHHDSVVARHWLADEAAAATPAGAFAAGVLTADGRRLEAKLRRQWRSRYRALA
jgi:CHAD domain-containing protein